jgi:uncharacterized damage-inducible protein DinB
MSHADGTVPGMVAPDVERVDPDTRLGEREMLAAWVDYHRATLLRKCAGLSDEQLKERSCPPSSMSLLGLVRHMTEVENGWFAASLTDEGYRPLYSSREERDGDWDNLDSAPTDDVFAAYLAECDKSRRVATGVGLDHTFEDRGKTFSVRWVYTHMIEEYARHNGHADLLRERIDGAVGE